MHTVGARLRARAASLSGERSRVRRRCFSVFGDGPTAQSVPPRPSRREKPGSTSTSTGATVTAIRRSSNINQSREAASSLDHAEAEGGRRVLAMTDADFPRVLNGPAPGYAEDALGRLLLGNLPAGAARAGARRGALETAPAVAKEEAGRSVDCRIGEESGGVGGTAKLESTTPLAGPAGLEGHVGAALSEGFSWESEEEEEEDQAPGLATSNPDDQANGYANDQTAILRCPPQEAFSSAAASGADVVYEEEDDFVDPLMEIPQAVDRGDKGEDKDEVELPYSTLYQMQLDREDQSHQEACEKYGKMVKELMTMGKGTQMKPIERLLTTWYPALKESIEREQEAVWANVTDDNKGTVKTSGSFGGRGTYGAFLVMLKADKQAVLVMHEVVNLILASGNKGVSTVRACTRVAELVQAEVNLMRMKKDGKKGQRVQVSSLRHVREVNKQAQDALDMLEDTHWPIGAQVKLGAALIKLLIETACWTYDKESGVVTAWDKGGAERGGGERDTEGFPMPKAAFVHDIIKGKNSRKGSLTMAPEIFSKMVDEDISRLATPRFVPMLVPPLDWIKPNRGGFLRLRAQIMRTKGEAAQKHALRRADLRQVYKALNCLGKVRWRINGHVLDTVMVCLRDKIAVGDLPVIKDLPLPPRPDGVTVDRLGRLRAPVQGEHEDEEVFKERRQKHYAYKRLLEKTKQKNANMHSLRCDMKIKVDIAQEFRDHVIYFPYNMDFRGRTYPIPPNLNILGSDFSRGVLVFDEAKPLGEKGLYWLKVHLANLYGEDKVSFDDRVAFVEKHMDESWREVRDSALRPLEGECWWKDADSPWQCLAVCADLTAALDSPDPARYLSRLPVHQDGSCNGLQHYAALGLDANGGAQVNLSPSPEPQDVYSGVCDVVKKKVALEASTVPPEGASVVDLANHEIAKMVDGLIDRKVVKQTVMTSVYGVTFVGARAQIQNVLGDKMIGHTDESGVPSAEVEENVYKASAYVAKHTMTVLEELFTEARNTMDWLKAVSQLVAKEDQPMSWITPLGLPVLQPYRRTDTYQVQTLLQGVHIREDSDKLPVAVKRQTTAFPPNFVHSLDSTHMMMTAIEMDKVGVPFAAVHDSYWVHAGNVDVMNDKLRQCFVDLYSGPILEDLHDSLRMRYPTIDFPPIPERGTLVLDSVKDSKYFFN
ncbi:mitochondrial DNA-directed RNA polymerase [Ectocarpus siliculosus]|uniref:DNA-directed RNA polymerase n=1 Tax=Ectocarpus siliculosus TaxID=2880 RepID=D7FQU5_ECTSI|nr:mitochondrial DNA-directed RNA polymerase [Ectocarpus siliculosus]|eukprot:CBJ30655.1 mitochondrial DNA-directed RNA polymerase [Ectocarpus siliculosus]